MIKDNFLSLQKDKENFLRVLSSDERLAKCLISGNKNFLDYELEEDDMDNLIYTQIFPYNHVLGTSNIASSYITMKFRYTRSKGANLFKNSNIIFYLFCGEAVVRTSYGVLRYDYMLQRLSELLNDTRSEAWLGKMMLDSVEDITVSADGKYLGIMAKFINVELM